jgi:hypothetical protein
MWQHICKTNSFKSRLPHVPYIDNLYVKLTMLKVVYYTYNICDNTCKTNSVKSSLLHIQYIWQQICKTNNVKSSYHTYNICYNTYVKLTVLKVVYHT